MNEREAVRRAIAANPEGARRLRSMFERGQVTGSVPQDGPLIILAGPAHSGITGSQQLRCEGCAGIVWITPSTQRMMAARRGQNIVCCMDCGIKKSKAEQFKSKKNEETKCTS